MARRRSSQIGRRRRDSNKPKRGKAAWQMFYSDNREEVKKQNPNLRASDITKKLGEMWRQCDENTKRRYLNDYQARKIEYDQKLAAYRAEQNQRRSKSKKNNEQTKKGNNNNDKTNEQDA